MNPHGFRVSQNQRMDVCPEADVAIRHAIHIGRATGAELVLLHAGTILEIPAGSDELGGASYAAMYEQYLADVREKLADTRARIACQGVDVSQTLIDGFADSALVRGGAEFAADLVVVGSHGHTGMRRFFLGSVAERVVRLAGTNVLVGREPVPDRGYRRIIVPTDFSRTAERALEAAMILAARDARIEVVHCWQLPAMATRYYVPGRSEQVMAVRLAVTTRRAARDAGEDLLARHRTERAQLRFEAVQGPPVAGIAERAAAGADLIVMGSHGRRGVGRFFVGSVAEMTVRHAPCSVLVVKHKARL